MLREPGSGIDARRQGAEGGNGDEGLRVRSFVFAQEDKAG